MKVKLAILAGAVATSWLVTATVSAQTFNPLYLREMPSAERVKAEIKGSDPIDTAARQAGAFWQLRRMIYDLALTQHRTDRQTTPDEQRIANGYYAAYYEVWQPVQKLLAQDRPQLFKLEGYATHPDILKEVLERFFSPAFRAGYYKAMGDMDARIKARQDADPIRVKPSTSNQPNNASQPTASPTGSGDTGAAAYKSQGDAYVEAKDYARAVEAYRKALSLDPSLYGASYGLGVAAISLNQYPEANAAFKQYLAVKPNDALAMILLGITYRELKQYPEAALAFQAAIRLRPEAQNLANAHYHLGVTYVYMRNKVAAVQVYTALQGIDSARAQQLSELINKTTWTAPPTGGLPASGAQAHYLEGNKYREAKEYAKAIEAYQQAIRLKPDYAEAHYQIGWIYNDQEQSAKAISPLQEAIRLKPDYPAACYELGYAYSNLNQYANALAAYQQAIRLKPDYAEAHYRMGLSYVYLKQYANALAAFQQAIRLKPDYAEAHYQIGWIYNDQDQSANAISSLQEALRLKPDYPTACYELGYAYSKLNQNANALAAYQQAVRLKPDYASAHLGLGMIYVRLGKTAEALQVYKTLQTLDKAKAQELLNGINQMK
jgi:tetratricopeptide (TPR) repeat protein